MRSLSALLLFLSSLTLSAESGIIALASRGDYLFFGDATGNMQIWTTEKKVIASLSLVNQTLELIAVHPYESLIAIAGNSSLSVWNWETKTELYRKPLTKHPFSLEFSPSGRYLFYADPTLTVLVALSGSPAPVLQEYTPSGDFFLLSSSEKNIMEYSMTMGSITYREFHSGKKIQTTSAPKNLRDFRLLDNRRYAFALTSRQLVLLDILSGILVNTYPLTADNLFLVGDRLIAIKKDGNNTQLSVFRVLNNNFYFQYSQSLSLSSSVEASSQKDLLLGSTTGMLYSYSLNDRTLHPLNSEYYLPIEDFAATDTDIFFTSADQLFQVSINTQTSRILGAGMRVFHSAQGAIFLTTEKRRNLSFPQILLSDPQQVKDISVSDEYVLLQYRDGLLSLRTFAGEEVFRYEAGLIETSLFIPEKREIIIGQPNTTFLGSSLYRINIDTTETVPIANPFFYVVDLFFGTQTLWVLGLQKDQEVSTLLLAYPEFSRSWQLARLPAESLNSSLLSIPQQRIPTLVGTGNLPIYWTEQGDFRTTSQKLQHSEAAISTDDFLITKQRGGSLVVLNTQNTRPLFEIYVSNGLEVKIRRPF